MNDIIDQQKFTVNIFFMIILSVLFILITSFLTGYGALSWLIAADPHFESDRLELSFLVLASGIMLNGWFAFVLTEMGLFSIWLIAIFSALVFLSSFINQKSQTALKFFKHKSSKTHWQLSEGEWIPVWVEVAVLTVWLIGAVFLFFRPHQAIWGAADVGVYINYAAHISQTGGLIIQEPLLADIPSELYPYFLSGTTGGGSGWSFLSPALDVNEMSGRIFTSFYHLQPVWQAVGWSIGGLSAGLMVTPLWGLLASVAFYLLLRHLFGGKNFGLAIFTLLALTISALQIWFVRYGTTEPLTQLLFLTGFISFSRWYATDYKSWTFGLLAGIALGMTFLARIDTFFIGIVPAVMLLLTLLGRFSWRNFAIFLAPFLLLAVHGSWHAIVFSPEYVSRLTTYMVNTALGPGLVLVLAAGVGGLLAAGGIWLWKDKIVPLFLPVRILLALIVLGYFLYAWFVRPYSGLAVEYALNGAAVESWNHENLVRLGWYFQPFGVWVAFAGALAMVLKKRWTHWYVLLPSLIYLLFYTWNLRSNGVQIYVMRRYVPIVLPFIMIATALLWQTLLKQHNKIVRYVGLFLAAVWFVGLASGTRGFASQVDYSGVSDQLADVSAQLPVESIILFNQPTPVGVGDFVGLPLRFMHGHHTFVLRDLDQDGVSAMIPLISTWLEAGNQVYWVDLPPHNGPSPLDFVEQLGNYPVNLRFDHLEHSYESKPIEVSPIEWGFELVELK